MRNRLIATMRRLPSPVRRWVKRLPGAGAVRDRLSGTPRMRGPGPGELRAVVYPPTWVHWDVMKQRPQYVLEGFARRGHPVYFVDVDEGGPREQDGIHIVPSLDLVPADGVIVYTHFAPVRTLLTVFDDPVIVYDILDDLSIFDDDEIGVPEERRVRSHHPDVVAGATVVMASAPELVSTHRRERGDIVYVENGVDTRRFMEGGPVPESMARLRRPVVGYHGMIARWFDFELIAGVAHTMPSVTFALVGPVDARTASAAQRLAALDNVVLLGEMPSSAMPGVVAGFDVGIVPFVVDDMTRAVSPLKMYEYLAGGIPVVASPLPVCVDHPLVTVGADVERFAEAITAALVDAHEPSNVARRRAAAADADWDRRLAPLFDRLDALDARMVGP